MLPSIAFLACFVATLALAQTQRRKLFAAEIRKPTLSRRLTFTYHMPTVRVATNDTLVVSELQSKHASGFYYLKTADGKQCVVARSNADYVSLSSVDPWLHCAFFEAILTTADATIDDSTLKLTADAGTSFVASLVSTPGTQFNGKYTDFTRVSLKTYMGGFATLDEDGGLSYSPQKPSKPSEFQIVLKPIPPHMYARVTVSTASMNGEQGPRMKAVMFGTSGESFNVVKFAQQSPNGDAHYYLKAKKQYGDVCVTDNYGHTTQILDKHPYLVCAAFTLALGRIDCNYRWTVATTDQFGVGDTLKLDSFKEQLEEADTTKFELVWNESNDDTVAMCEVEDEDMCAKLDDDQMVGRVKLIQNEQPSWFRLVLERVRD